MNTGKRENSHAGKCAKRYIYAYTKESLKINTELGIYLSDSEYLVDWYYIIFRNIYNNIKNSICLTYIGKLNHTLYRLKTVDLSIDISYRRLLVLTLEHFTARITVFKLFVGDLGSVHCATI